jgi:YhcH/YjgK/YiaL family protein
MIIDTLDNARLYENLHPLFAAGFEWVRAAGADLAPGRFELDGGMYALVQAYESKPVEGALFEAHRKFIDIQYILSGEETIYYAPLARLDAGEYQPEKDYLPLTGAGMPLALRAGDFAVFFPADAHLPGRVSASGPSPVKKIVIKVPV